MFTSMGCNINSERYYLTHHIMVQEGNSRAKRNAPMAAPEQAMLLHFVTTVRWPRDYGRSDFIFFGE